MATFQILVESTGLTLVNGTIRPVNYTTILQHSVLKRGARLGISGILHLLPSERRLDRAAQAIPSHHMSSINSSSGPLLSNEARSENHPEEATYPRSVLGNTFYLPTSDKSPRSDAKCSGVRLRVFLPIPSPATAAPL